MLSPQRKLHLFSPLLSFSSTVVLLFFIPLALISIIACILGPEKSFLPISAQFAWSYAGFYSSYSHKSFNEEFKYDYLDREAEVPSNLSIINSAFHQKVVLEDQIQPLHVSASFLFLLNFRIFMIVMYDQLETLLFTIHVETNTRG